MAWPAAGPDASDLDLTIRRRSRQVSPRDMQDINPLPDDGLSIAPTERLARQPAGNGKWPAAIVISCALHAAVAAAFFITPKGAFDLQDALQSEGTDQAGDKVAGSALDRESQAVNVILVPNKQPAKPTPARPSPPPQPSQPARQVMPTPKPPVEAQPTREAATPPVAEPARQPSATPDILVANAARDDNQSVAAKTGEPAAPTIQPEIPEATVAATARPPIPSPRPTPRAAAAASQADKKSGAADGQVRSAPTASKGKTQKEAGSAVEDTYRSNVFSKLGSINRTLPPSLQLSARSNAAVVFVIGRKGNIDELRILESSGSAAFDQAALGIVRKAAPFPPIPPQAESPTLKFEVGIGPF